MRETDNRDLVEVSRYLEARIAVLHSYIRRLEAELEARKRDEQTVGLLLRDSIRLHIVGLGYEFTAVDPNAHLGATECERIGSGE